MAPAARPNHGFVDNELAVLLAPYARAAGLVGTGPFNLGVADDHRVPDHGYHRVLPTDLWVPTAAVVVEVVSPDDETFEKFGFYTQHHVDELIIANPTARSIRTFRRTGDSFLETSCSDLLQISTEALATGVNWP